MRQWRPVVAIVIALTFSAQSFACVNALIAANVRRLLLTSAGMVFI